MMEGWKETEIGLMPIDWEVIKLGDIILKSKGGGTPSTKNKEYWDGDIYWTTSKWLDEEKIFLEDGEKTITKIGLNNSSTNLLPPNNLLISTRVVIGKVAINKIPIAFSQDLTGLWIDSKLYDLIFLAYQIKSKKVKDYLQSLKRGATIQGITREDLLNTFLVFPPLPEQHKIAYILRTVQKAIEQQDKLIRTTTELKKALMQKLFTEGLYGDQKIITDFGYSPESWKIQPFENTGEVVYGIQAAVAKNLKPIGNKILTNKNITLDGRITLEKLNYFELSTKRHFQTILKKGDLLFNWRSGSKEHVGKTALFNLEDGEYTHSSFILRIRVNEKHHSVFLYYYLNFLRETGYYQKVQTYSINAKFNKSAINAMPIALPGKDEQIEIANIIASIDKKLDNHIAKRKLIQDLFKTLLHELMTGQRKVHEIDFQNNKEELLMAAEPEMKYNIGKL